LFPRATALGPRLEDELQRKWASAQAAWPGIEVPAAQVLALWARRLGDIPDDALLAELAGLRGDDLYIAFACGTGDPAALRAFEARYFQGLDAVVGRISGSPATVREIEQIMREKLFVAAGAEPRIVEMAGHGDLAGLIRVVAIRIALNLRAAAVRNVPLDHAELAVLAPECDPELAAIGEQHRAAVKAAFETALDALRARERSVLRMHLIDQLSIDDIGRAFDVHRATAARWLERIRADLRDTTLRVLRDRLALPNEELHRIIRGVESRLQISFQRILDR
jgi:RNA polymerase sigma-70 factor (ECF subfamily)